MQCLFKEKNTSVNCSLACIKFINYIFFFTKVPLGVILKNENVKEDMIEIMEALQKYVLKCQGIII